jgi:hypothetical protein
VAVGATADRYGWLMPPSTARPIRPGAVLAREIQMEKELEVKWLSAFKDFRTWRSKNKVAYLRLVQQGIPNSLRSRLWLHIVHGKSEQMDAPSRKTKVKDDRPNRYRHYLNKAARETPDLLVCPWLGAMADPALVETVRAVLVGYLNADPDVSYHPNMGYIASIFVAYMPDVLAWTAFLYLMKVKRHGAHGLFLPNQLTTLVLLWDYFLRQKMREFKDKLTQLHISHEEYVVEWFQTAFLKIPFSGMLSLGLFDQFIAFGPRGLIMNGLMLVKSMLPRLLVVPKERALDMLRNPAPDPVFADGIAALARINAMFITKSEYQKVIPIIDPESASIKSRKKR